MQILSTGKFHTVEYCGNCSHAFTFRDLFEQCCPYCGAAPATGKLFISGPKATVRQLIVSSSPWWMFWNHQYVWEGSDAADKEWLTRTGRAQLPESSKP